MFRSFAEQMPPEIELWPVQLPGRENRFGEPLFTHMDALIEALREALVPYLDRPYAFFGHSMGTLVSFELTRALRRSHHPYLPQHLFVSALQAPHLTSIHAPIHELPGERFFEELRQYNGIPEDLFAHPEFLQLMLPLLQADFQVCETYQYQEEPALACPITAFGGHEDQYVPATGLAAWKQLTLGSFQTRLFAGDHFFLLHHQREMISVITQLLTGEISLL